MTTIIYVHGFASGKTSKTASYFSEFGDVVSVEYDSADTYEANFKNLEKQVCGIVESIDDVVIVGTSLGGFYAKRLADRFCVNSILINPVVYPVEVLSKFIGENVNFSTGKRFELTKDVVLSYENHPVKRSCPCLVLVSENDEFIDGNVEKCQKEYSDKAKVIVTKTAHRVEREDILSRYEDITELMNTLVL